MFDCNLIKIIHDRRELAQPIPDLRELFYVNHSGIWSLFTDFKLQGHSEYECSALRIEFNTVSDLLIVPC